MYAVLNYVNACSKLLFFLLLHRSTTFIIKSQVIMKKETVSMIIKIAQAILTIIAGYVGGVTVSSCCNLITT